MHTPATAMLWELWRLTRRGMAIQVSMSVLLGLSVLTVAGFYGAQDTAATLVLFVLLMLLVGMSLTLIRGMDNRPGFPLSLGYARPVPTWLLAGVPMVYLGASCAALYLVPAIVLRTAFGIPFPLAPVAGGMAATVLVLAAGHWWTRNKALQNAGAFVLYGCVFLGYRTLHTENLPGNDFPPARWPETFAFSLADYGLNVMLGVAAIAVTIAGVERQRRGEDTFTLRRAGETTGRPKAPGWLTNTLRLPCPTSSPARAQVWLEMRRVGGQVLAVGVMAALAIPVLFSLWNAYGLEIGLLGPLIAPVWPLLVGLASMLGLRRRQGVADMSTFEATRALSTARLIGVKVLVTVVCIVGAWAVLATRFWVSLQALEPWGGRARTGVAEVLDALSGGRLAAIVLLVVVQLAAVVACFAAVQLLFVLHARRVTVTLLGVGLYGLRLALTVAGGWAGSWVVTAHVWAAAALMPLGAMYVFRRAQERPSPHDTRRGRSRVAVGRVRGGVGGRSSRQRAGSHRHALGVRRAGAVSALVPLAAVALAPWSFSLLRHR